MPTRAACRAEIEALHDFFVEWYAGTIEESEFERMEQAIGADFEMVTPDGTRRDRPAVLDAARESYGRDEPGEFAIEIRDVEIRWESGKYATTRYEEYQETDAETTGRISTVLFREEPGAPGGLVWLDLHETWIEGHESRDS